MLNMFAIFALKEHTIAPSKAQRCLRRGNVLL